MRICHKRRGVGLTVELILAAALGAGLLPHAAAQSPTRQPGGAGAAHVYRATMLKAQKALESNDAKLLRQLLDGYHVRPGEEDPRGWEWHQLDALQRVLARVQTKPQVALSEVGTGVRGLVWSGNGERLLVLTSLYQTDPPVRFAIKLIDVTTGRLVRTFSGPYWAVAVSPDGQRLAAGAWKWERQPADGNEVSRSVTVWETATGKELFSQVHRLGLQQGNPENIPLAWSLDSQRLAYPGAERQAFRVWEAATGKEVLFRGHRDLVSSLAWDRDGNQLASGSPDGTVRVWNARTGQQVFLLAGLDAAVGPVSLSPEGKQLAVSLSEAGDKGRVAVYDLATRRVRAEVIGQDHHRLKVHALAWSADGRQLILDGEKMQVLDLASGLPIHSYIRSMNELAALSPDGKRLALLIDGRANSGDVLRILDTTTGQGIQDLTQYGREARHEKPIRLAWRPDGKGLATATYDGKVRVWDVAAIDADDRQRSFQDVLSFAWGPDSQHFALLVRSPKDRPEVRGQLLHIGSVPPGEKLLRLEGERGPATEFGAVVALAASTDGQRLAVVHRGSRSIHLWDIANNRILQRLAGHTKLPTRTYGGQDLEIRELLWSPGGRRLASCARDGTLKVWDTASGKELAGFDFGDPGRKEDWLVGWSPDDRYLAFWKLHVHAFSTTYSLFVLDVDSGQPAQHIKSEWLAAATTLAWSPDGKQLAVAGGERAGGVTLYDLATGAATATANVAAGVQRLTWSLDGKQLLLGAQAWNKSVLWDSTRNTLTDVPACPPDAVWSPDGRQLAALGRSFRGNVVVVWDAASGKEIRRLRAGLQKLHSGAQIITEEMGFPGEHAQLLWMEAGLRLLTAEDSRGEYVQGLDPASGKVLFILPRERNPASDLLKRALRLPREATASPGDANARFTAVAWRPDGKQLAVKAGWQGIQIRDAATGQLIHQATPGFNIDPYAAWEWSLDGAYLGTNGDNGLQLWDIAGKGKNNQTLRGERSSRFARSLAWSPDSKRVAALTAQRDTALVKVWEAATGKETLIYDLKAQALNYPAGGLAWSPDGKWLAVGGTAMLVLDVGSAEEIFNLPAGAGRNVFWSSDGRRLITYGQGLEEGHKVWDTATGAEIMTLRGQALQYQLSPDRRWAALAPTDESKWILLEVSPTDNGGR